MQLIDCVIMTFSKELPVLKLNILTLLQNFHISCLNNIYILVNDKNSSLVIEEIKKDYLKFFKHLENKVTIVDGLELLGNDYYGRETIDINNGFLSQMITDCAVARLVETPYYIVVDSKSLFLPNTGPWLFFKNNKTILPMGYLLDKELWRTNLEYFTATELFPGFQPSIVRPFVYHTLSMRKMIEVVERKSNFSWTDFMINSFQEKNCVSGICHAFLYYAFLYKENIINEVYEVQCPGHQLDLRIMDYRDSFPEDNTNYLTITIARSLFVEKPYEKDEAVQIWKRTNLATRLLEETFDQMVKINQE